MYKAFVRTHLDYGDIIYDNPSNDSFIQKTESIQYNTALASAGAIPNSFRKKLCKELGF